MNKTLFARINPDALVEDSRPASDESWNKATVSVLCEAIFKLSNEKKTIKAT
jgi:hypothetical protein